MKLKIDRAVLEEIDDEVIVQDIALELAESFNTAAGDGDSYRANPQLTRAQVNLVLVGLSLIEVLNGGVFQLIMNSSGALIPDLPDAYRDIGLNEEAKIFAAIVALFPSAAVLRDPESRDAFATTRLIPGGWDGLVVAKGTAIYRQLTDWDDKLGDLLQGEDFYIAVADYLEGQSDSFEIIDID